MKFYLAVLINHITFALKNRRKHMKMTKEEALKRFKDALLRKKAWEEKFEAKYADVANLYAIA